MLQGHFIVNSAHVRESMPDSGLSLSHFSGESPQKIQAVLPSLGSGLRWVGKGEHVQGDLGHKNPPPPPKGIRRTLGIVLL